MIFSDRQYQIAKVELAKLQAALDATLSNEGGETEWLQQVELDALKSQIAELEGELAEYKLLKSGQITFSETCALSELPRVLIQARIAKGLSQTDLAGRLKMKPQQVQRYEATNYMSASLARLIEVAGALEVKISESFETRGAPLKGAIFAWSDPNDVSWSRLPLNEMIKRKWFDVAPGANAVNAVRDFFLSSAGPQFATALHRKKVRSGNLPNEYALLAWQARALWLANDMVRKQSIQSFELIDTWVPELVALTRATNGAVKARKVLAQHGVALVIERHLPGTYLDGAAMLAPSGHPVIGLTLRHDRLDNFWFVLFHELGHIFLHLFDSLRFDFFDEEDGVDSDDMEKQADEYALHTLIPSELWDQCLSRFALTEEAVRLDADRLGIDASIIAGRIRKERNNYMILNGLIGQDMVRPQFEGQQS